MSVQELMTMLNAKNVRFDVGSGGIPSLTWDDLAAAIGMSRLERNEYCLLRVKWLNDAYLVSELTEHIVTEINAMSKGWRQGYKAQTITGLARLTLISEVDSRRCPKCHGVGYINQVLCRLCQGSGGKLQMSNRRKAKLCDVDEKAWRNTWATRYDELLLTVGEWERSAARQISKKLFEGRQ